MQLTGRQIVSEGIITGFDPVNAVQQQGVDLRVIEIHYLEGVGRIPREGKTQLPKYTSVPFEGESLTWFLQPGYYEVVFEEGCKMPNNRAMTFVQRSSALRNGLIVRSSQFDAGFETEHMGTFIEVFHPVRVDYKARIAQTLVMETANVAEEDLYQGQFQGDSQRKA